MRWEDVLRGLMGKVGNEGLRELEGALDKLENEAKDPWKRAVLQLAGDAVEAYGLEGLSKVEELVSQIGKGGTPDLGFASLRARSDYLAMLQNKEADSQSKARDFMKVVGQQIGVVLKAILSSLVK
jgi:hypothetical protein